MSVEEETQAKRREDKVAKRRGIRSYLMTGLAHRYYVKRIVIRRIADLFPACSQKVGLHTSLFLVEVGQNRFVGGSVLRFAVSDGDQPRGNIVGYRRRHSRLDCTAGL